MTPISGYTASGNVGVYGEMENVFGYKDSSSFTAMNAELSIMAILLAFVGFMVCIVMICLISGFGGFVIGKTMSAMSDRKRTRELDEIL